MDPWRIRQEIKRKTMLAAQISRGNAHTQRIHNTTEKQYGNKKTGGE